MSCLVWCRLRRISELESYEKSERSHRTTWKKDFNFLFRTCSDHISSLCAYRYCHFHHYTGESLSEILSPVNMLGRKWYILVLNPSLLHKTFLYYSVGILRLISHHCFHSKLRQSKRGSRKASYKGSQGKYTGYLILWLSPCDKYGILWLFS